MPKYEVKILLEAASFYEQIVWIPQKTPKLSWLFFRNSVLILSGELMQAVFTDKNNDCIGKTF